MRFVRALITNHPLANIAFVVVILMGLIAYSRMPREQDPEINFNWVNIITVLPGASAEDVEKRVTNPLEDALRKVQDTKFVISSSREGLSNILVRFRDVPVRVFDKRVTDLRREIQNKANAELPVEAEDPEILEITSSNGFPTAMVMLTGQADDEHLRSATRIIRDDLEQIPGVDAVLALGFQDPELLVEFDPPALAARGLTAIDLAEALRLWFRDVFAGKAQTGSSEWLVRVSGATTDPELLARFYLQPPGATAAHVPLDAVAQVRRSRDDPLQLTAMNGQPGVMLSITKIGYTNTLELIGRIRDYIDRKNAVLAGSGLRLTLTDDQTVPTRQALGVMQNNAAIGLLLVLAVCWLFLGSRIAAMVALGVVFSVAGAFVILDAVGSTLNVSVLLGIVIVLGMLVDDAVVIVEATYFRMERGMAALDATLDALREVGLPVFAAVSTTIAAFLPLMLLPGIVGKFMFVIPFVVTVGLVVSLIEAFWILPAHVSALGSRAIRRSKTQALRQQWTHWVRVKYTRLLIRVMRYPLRYLGLALALFIGAGAAVGAGWIKLQFFAFDPIRLYYVNVNMPADAPLEATLRQTLAVEERVRAGLRASEARSVVSLAGIQFTETEVLYGDQYGQIAVSLNPATSGMRGLDRIIEDMRETVIETPGRATISFLKLSGGPPIAKSISVKVRADDRRELRAAADAVKTVVARIPGARDVVDNDIAGRAELSLRVDVNAARNAGLDPGAVARLVRLHLDGEVVADLRDQGEKVELRVRAAPRTLARIEDLLDDPIALPGGATTHLGALLIAVEGESLGLIRHWNLRRAITVEADLDPAMNNTLSANHQLRTEWELIRGSYPNTDLDFSGELDDINESLDAMGPLFLLGVGLIYLILAAQFRSYFQPFLILVTVPLAFTGVTLGLLVSGNPLSLYTLYGVIALTGIAVNAAIVLIDAANARRAKGIRTLHATLYAARRRVIAILMTTGTTIAGLFSLAFGLAGQSLLWGPVAASIVWGLAFSTVLTLFVVPVLYRFFMRQRRSFKFKSVA
ncbi:MAG: efflux RND transporter permease subunit [Candidatus Competibacteraceae bacterium]|nr:efflux RND transporter permease subunit [Candidatus Competibacteraceae bacterium]